MATRRHYVKPDGSTQRVLNCYIPTALKIKVDVWAAQREVRVGQIVIEALEEYFANHADEEEPEPVAALVG
jgi:hypothetical protein